MHELELTPEEEADNAIISEWIADAAQGEDEYEIRSHLWDLWYAGNNSPLLVFTEISHGKKNHLNVEKFFLEDFTEDVPENLLGKYTLVWWDPETGDAW